jgi:signal transduction histidine kinase
MTSHELRNPLSAVVQCADSVMSTLQQITPKHLQHMNSEYAKFNDEIAMCTDSLQTIVSCSLHQKRVIDDVLTLSKLDSSLVLITPIRVQPTSLVSEAIKMFEVQCSRLQITLAFVEDKSLKGFEWVMLDPSRLLQVLINLLYVVNS